METGLSVFSLIPFTVLGWCGLAVFAGLILTLRDQHARDTGRIHALGITLIGAGILGCFFIGIWNILIGLNAYLRYGQELAAAVPFQ